MIGQNSHTTTQKLFTYTAFAIAMAYLETAVVFYLRLLYYPEGFTFPMKTIPMQVALIELGREAATLLMLWFAARMSSFSFKEQFALFAYTFAVWDIFYYFWLKILINWPVSWSEWDILFLIPVPWIAPWLAPVLISLGLVCGGLIVMFYPERFPPKIFSRNEWLILFAAAALILASFFTETGIVLKGGAPQNYNWPLFFIGYVLGWIVFLQKFFSTKFFTPKK